MGVIVGELGFGPHPSEGGLLPAMAESTLLLQGWHSPCDADNRVAWRQVEKVEVVPSIDNHDIGSCARDGLYADQKQPTPPNDAGENPLGKSATLRAIRESEA